MDIKSASVRLSFERTKSEMVSVKLRVTYRREQRRYAFPVKGGVLVTEKDFDRLLKYHEKGSERTAEEIRQIYNDIKPFISLAESLTLTLQPFSFDAFREAFYMMEEAIVQDDPNNVLHKLYEKSEAMKASNRLGSASSYKDTAVSIARFVDSFDDLDRKEFLNIPIPTKRNKTKPNVVLRFENITPKFLEVYQQWMLNFGKSPKKKNLKKGELPPMPKPATLTTVGIYCRQLRSVFNDAISDNIISQDCYPFGKRGFTVPAGTNTKKALTKSDILKILNFECEPDSFQQRGKDLWIFSYLSNGMNITDICNIKWRDVDRKENNLTFIRQKTARTRKGNQSRVRVKLRPESWDIINRYSDNEVPESYLFPFLNASMTEEQKKATIAQIVKMTNQHMRAIAKILKIDTDVSTYAARHSFATILLQSEAPIAFISQALGHQNISTTQAYLGSFDDEKTKNYLNALL
ncbi:site-specific integrase [Dyadobacter tibetensis]|uniref:site-specific integrase n=1 Tax=Dyadobacter tibetensis TaxID=1211851 RepID=UPI0004710B87|nr:site-specific integrase [Dyadobacter tibetensis]